MGYPHSGRSCSSFRKLTTICLKSLSYLFQNFLFLHPYSGITMEQTSNKTVPQTLKIWRFILQMLKTYKTSLSQCSLKIIFLKAQLNVRKQEGVEKFSLILSIANWHWLFEKQVQDECFHKCTEQDKHESQNHLKQMSTG